MTETLPEGFITVTALSFYASALIEHDYSSIDYLTDDPAEIAADRAAIDSLRSVGEFVDCASETHFGWCEGCRRHGEVVTYTVRLHRGQC